MTADPKRSGDFTVHRRVDIWHGDGWGIRIEENADEFCNFRLMYIEDIDGKGEKEGSRIDLWPEAARLLVNALSKMLDDKVTT